MLQGGEFLGRLSNGEICWSILAASFSISASNAFATDHLSPALYLNAGTRPQRRTLPRESVT
ncbi:hypothetical protein MF672_039835 [Actinomadura sp. ATCC 31491]|uniref:DUF397 domain-containing protein n=1 Tax=Actinomadura luzonensis TaxID=2805427 RepID=A0ABT0G5K7_9ACTN|nr:hypothetical protein [Actinomadura luzonensis]MCK2219905.1 hypothetical protein [Actinomadura luzonensis]